VKDVPDSLWTSLIAGKDKHGRNADGVSRYACLEALKTEDTSGDIRIDDLMRKKSTSSDLKRYLERVRNICWNRKGLVTILPELEGDPAEPIRQFGIGPNEMMRGDLLCVIYGCSVPVILRQAGALPFLGQVLHAETPSKAKKVIPENIEPGPALTGAPSSSRSASRRGKRAASAGEGTPGKRPRTRDANSSNNSQVQAHNSIEEVYFKVIGECFVDRFMEGHDGPSAAYEHTEQRFTLV